ncbi:hypothetical protein Tco_1548457 [Tanacetum coccineum]
MKIMSVVSVKVDKLHGYGYLEEIVVRQADRQLYTFKKGDFINLHLNDIEDMLLLVVQHKLFHLDSDAIIDLAKKLNITKPQKDFPTISGKELYTPSFDPPEDIYEDLSNRKRLMRDDELYKFSDGTLKLVRDTLYHKLWNFRLRYNKGMPNKKWSAKDQIRSGIMVKLIKEELMERRIMRNLERLVGTRELKMDYRMMRRINQRDLPRDILLDRIEVYRYDTIGVKVRMGIMQTKTKLTLEQTQQGVSDEFLNIKVILHSIHIDDENPTSANIKQALWQFVTAKEKNLSQPSASTPVVVEMHKEDLQAASVQISLGGTSQESASHQEPVFLASTLVHSYPNKSDPKNSLFEQQGNDEGTKNFSFDHFIAGTNPSILVDKTQSVGYGLGTVQPKPKIKNGSTNELLGMDSDKDAQSFVGDDGDDIKLEDLT